MPRTCEFCGSPLDASAAPQARRHPQCKAAANYLDALQRALVDVETLTPDRARALRSRLMSLANTAQWRTEKMGRNLRRRSG